MEDAFKRVRTCAEHGFALSPEGACVRCEAEATRVRRRRAVAQLGAGGVFLLTLLGAGALRARSHRAAANERVATESPGPSSSATLATNASGHPLNPTSSSSTDAVLHAWKTELARAEAERSEVVAAEASAQAAAEKQRLIDAYRIPDAGRAPAPRAPPRPAYAGVTPHDGWPSLPYEQFLPDTADTSRRQALWPLFHQAEAEAQAFAVPGDPWVPITRVEYGSERHAGEWSTTGVIQMKEGKDAGLMFHEIFHAAFHKSEFNSSHTDRDGTWNEAFCDAFRYFAERQLLSERSGWVDKIDRMTTLTSEDAPDDGDGYSTRKYKYPASLIVKRAGGPNGSLGTLRGLWYELITLRRQGGGAPVLDQFFGYAPPQRRDD
jgi:hypothetical protein